MQTLQFFLQLNSIYNLKELFIHKTKLTMSEKNSIHVIDKLARNRVFISRYWKEECFALNAETIIDKAIKLRTIGGLYGGAKKPTKFMCLLLKMLQMNLPKQIALQYLKARQYKYLSALTLTYLRLTTKGPQVHQLLQPFYNDNRKLVIKDSIGRHQIIHIDEWVDKLLNDQVVMGVVLPFLPKRINFEEQGVLEARESVLEAGEGQLVQEENSLQEEREGDGIIEEEDSDGEEDK